MNKKPVNGMRDILPEEMAVRNRVLSMIRECYRSFGFTEIETPVCESIENLSGKLGGENEKLIFRIMKRGEKLDIENAKTENDLADSGLRYDLTLPLSRYYANHQAELPKPFKALQIGPVFRADRPQKGRYREFYQCDIDILGEPGILAETELILATSTVLSRLGFRKVTIRVNDRRILKGMALSAGFPEDALPEVFVILDKLDKIGKEGVQEELEKEGYTKDNAERLLRFFDAAEGKSPEDALAAFRELLKEQLPDSVTGDLNEIFRTLSELSPEGVSLSFDPSLVRGMGYYTGPIFEIAVPEFNSSVGGGGRYDEMIGRFSGVQVPACGFSIGFERIVSILMENASGSATEKKTAVLLEKGLSSEKKTEVLKDAMKKRAEGQTVLVLNMIKNRRFQKEQLEASGYTDIIEVYENPLKTD